MTMSNVLTDDSLPWEQLPGEPSEWYNRFHQFLMLPGKRSLLAAYNAERCEKGRERASGCPDNWRSAFKQWRWAERAAAWDAHNNEVVFQQWQERRSSLREREWEMSQASFDKAIEMLKFPVMQKKTIDGTTIIEPGKWTFKDAAAILVASSNLARRACGMDEDLMLKQQLSTTYDLLQKLLTLEDSATAATAKELVRSHLDALLLQIGKPVPEVIEVLQQAMETESVRASAIIEK